MRILDCPNYSEQFKFDDDESFVAHVRCSAEAILRHKSGPYRDWFFGKHGRTTEMVILFEIVIADAVEILRRFETTRQFSEDFKNHGCLDPSDTLHWDRFVAFAVGTAFATFVNILPEGGNAELTDPLIDEAGYEGDSEGRFRVREEESARSSSAHGRPAKRARH
ncbi:hypothetical protein A0H81_09515 [Grifola frondosa]|uniref:Uncharacterized protein n=1 Tax=Grifola frondosa TaxID=5627 RepID=A0A1C7M398_GRIFR|nr:hypothetical protein A0H81_09515 [Grifola frondosa]